MNTCKNRAAWPCGEGNQSGDDLPFWFFSIIFADDYGNGDRKKIFGQR